MTDILQTLKGLHAFDAESGNCIWKDSTPGTAHPLFRGKAYSTASLMELQYLRTDGLRIVGGRSGSIVSGDYICFKGSKRHLRQAMLRYTLW